MPASRSIIAYINAFLNFAAHALRGPFGTFALKQAQPLSARRLTSYYVAALLIIAGLTLASHLMLTYVLSHNQGTAAIINVSGRQRMLSQRIASLAAEYRLGDATARPALLTAINEFATTEAALSAANRDIAAPGAETLQVRNIYAGGTDSLDTEVGSFVADARQIASLPPADPAAAAPLKRLFAAARSTLLDKLNEIVAIHQSQTERILAELEDLQLSILAVVLLTLTIEALMIFRPMVSRIVSYTEEITRLASIDPLTELHNRRGFLQRCEDERVRAQRYGRQLCLLMLDADHFKQINDNYSHYAGDEMLRAMADALREVLRASDVAARLGGEEFAVLAPETDLKGATMLGERLRARIAGKAITFNGQTIKITVSIGVAPVPAGADGIGAALREADHLMYSAKRAGRNRVVSAEPSLSA